MLSYISSNKLTGVKNKRMAQKSNFPKNGRTMERGWTLCNLPNGDVAQSRLSQCYLVYYRDAAQSRLTQCYLIYYRDAAQSRPIVAHGHKLAV